MPPEQRVCDLQSLGIAVPLCHEAKDGKIPRGEAVPVADHHLRRVETWPTAKLPHIVRWFAPQGHPSIPRRDRRVAEVGLESREIPDGLTHRHQRSQFCRDRDVGVTNHPRVLRKGGPVYLTAKQMGPDGGSRNSIVTEVASEPYKEETPTMLRHPEVSRIEQEVTDVVPEIVCLSGDPSREVVPEMLPHSRYVFHDERWWLRMAYDRKEVLIEQVTARVGDTALADPLFLPEETGLLPLADPRESLARGAPDDDLRGVRERAQKIRHRDLVYVTVLGSAKHDGVLVSEGPGESFRRRLVVLDGTDTFTTSSLETEGHASGTGEQVKNGRVHR